MRDTDHPITRGLPPVWMHAKDELYDTLRGPAEDMHILATAYSIPEFDGTGKHEPMMMTLALRPRPRVSHGARPRRLLDEVRRLRDDAPAAAPNGPPPARSRFRAREFPDRRQIRLRSNEQAPARHNRHTARTHEGSGTAMASSRRPADRCVAEVATSRPRSRRRRSSSLPLPSARKSTGRAEACRARRRSRPRRRCHRRCSRPAAITSEYSGSPLISARSYVSDRRS